MMGMAVRSPLPALLLGCSLVAILPGCAKRPHFHGQVTLHLMADRDFAQILLAHCETGIDLAGAITSLKIDQDIAAIAERMRQNEEGDRAAILSWIANQSAQPSAVGDTHSAETRTSHAAVIQQLRLRNVEQLNEHVLRVLVSHYNEELAVIDRTPVQDKNLRRIVDSIQRRLSKEAKELTRRLPATAG